MTLKNSHTHAIKPWREREVRQARKPTGNVDAGSLYMLRHAQILARFWGLATSSTLGGAASLSTADTTLEAFPISSSHTVHGIVSYRTSLAVLLGARSGATNCFGTGYVKMNAQFPDCEIGTNVTAFFRNSGDNARPDCKCRAEARTERNCTRAFYSVRNFSYHLVCVRRSKQNLVWAGNFSVGRCIGTWVLVVRVFNK